MNYISLFAELAICKMTKENKRFKTKLLNYKKIFNKITMKINFHKMKNFA
jgi:translation initiation factor IF-1